MPVALPFIAVALAAAGTGVAAYGAVSQGHAAKEAGKANQEAENANAKAAMDAAALEAGQVRRKNLLRLGTQRANAAKSGVLINDSAADVIYDTSIQGELEALSSLYSGKTSATYAKSRGNIARYEGNQQGKASYINAGSTVLGGLSKTASMYPSTKPSSSNRSDYGPS